MLPILILAVTHLTEISYVANSPIVNADVPIKIILKKATSDKNNIKKCHISNLILKKSKNQIKII